MPTYTSLESQVIRAIKDSSFRIDVGPTIKDARSGAHVEMKLTLPDAGSKEQVMNALQRALREMDMRFLSYQLEGEQPHYVAHITYGKLVTDDDCTDTKMRLHISCVNGSYR